MSAVHPVMAFALIPVQPPRDEHASVMDLAARIEREQENSRQAKAYCGEILEDESDPDAPKKARLHHENFVQHYEDEIERLKSYRHGRAAWLVVQDRARRRAR